METKNMGLYIHIPFCKSKCKYCDFISFANKEDILDEYIKWLKYELIQVGDGNKSDYEGGLDKLINLKTIYIGGGTPSFINSRYIKEILDEVNKHFNVDDNAEITLEMNPGTVNEKKIVEYKEAGINRLSIGLQSTHNKILKQIGRIHTYEDFLEAYNLARKIGFKNINVDLMLGLPEQSLEELVSSVEAIIKLNPEHISIYSLILEENTALYDEVNSGKICLPDDELERKMYWKTKKMLENAGYIHYEISNFAKKGYESRHNISCWNGEEYIGIGAAAHSYTNNIRYSNIDKIEEYINNFKIGEELDNLIFHEKQDMESKMKEYMILGLRKLDGISIKEFKSNFTENPIFKFKNELKKLVEEGLLVIDGDKIKLTDKGLDFANLVWEEFV